MILLFFALIALSWILSNQILPLEEAKIHLSVYLDSIVLGHKKWFKFVRRYVSHLFNCNACIAFWMILIVMSSWQLAVIGYIISALLASRLNSTSL